MAEYTDNYGLIEPTYAELADIDPLNGNFETIDEIMHASQVSLADAYDLTETYNTGDVVMYQYYMYKCKEDNVTGAWDAEKWERTTAGANGSGGGGTEVVANPVGTPTADLQTIEIAGTIYDIPGGGGSGGNGGGISDEVIFTDTAGTTGTRNITLTKSLNNFDAIYFEWFGTTEEQYTASHASPVYPIEANDNGNVSVVCYPTYGNRYILLTGDPTSTSVSLASGTWDTVPLSVYKIHGVKFKGVGAISAEVIPITAGDGTTSRTFSFNRQPKSIKIYYKSAAVGYNLDASLVWGQDFINYLGHTNGVSISGGSGGLAALSYGVDGKSFTITGGNAFGALNDADGAGFMFVDYGEGGGGSDNLADMTWTLLASTTSTSQAETIPADTKWLVVTAEFGGTEVALVAKESISNINKIMELSQLSKLVLSGSWRDSAGNNATPAAEISNGQVVAVSSYHTVTTKVYAVS